MSKRHSILIVADHASNFIPDEYNNLGLSQELIDTHIAYDIGVKQLALKLSQRLKTHLVMGCLLYTSPSPRDLSTSRMPSSA